MEIVEALEKLNELFRSWNLTHDDWILCAQYAFRLLGYDVEVREGHLNVLVNRWEIPWPVGEALETYPPEGTVFKQQYDEFMNQTGFEFDLRPKSDQEFTRRRNLFSVFYGLDGGNKIRVQTPEGDARELEVLLSECTPEGWGPGKAARILPAIKDQKRAVERKGEKALAATFGRLINKYENFIQKDSASSEPTESKKNKIMGIPASNGRVEGRAKIVLDPEQSYHFQLGEILVTQMTSPKFTPLLTKAAAVVTDEGGKLCHAAIVSRELGIPCVVGTKLATVVLKDGDLIEVNADRGLVTILERQ